MNNVRYSDLRYHSKKIPTIANSLIALSLISYDRFLNINALYLNEKLEIMGVVGNYSDNGFV